MSNLHYHFKKEELFNPFGARRFFKQPTQQEESQAGGQAAADPWGLYWTSISGDIPSEQIGTWMKEWEKDPDFPWQEITQDYVNVYSTSEKPAFKITPEGGLQMQYNPFSPPSGKLGRMTPQLATPFQWGEPQINQYNQFIEMMANAPLYPYAAQLVKERERARGIGERPITGVNIPMGGQLLGGEASALAPEAAINAPVQGGVNPLTGTQLVMGG